jgi:hypothetical protein
LVDAVGEQAVDQRRANGEVDGDVFDAATVDLDEVKAGN